MAYQDLPSTSCIFYAAQSANNRQSGDSTKEDGAARSVTVCARRGPATSRTTTPAAWTRTRATSRTPRWPTPPTTAGTRTTGWAAPGATPPTPTSSGSTAISSNVVCEKRI